MNNNAVAFCVTGSHLQYTAVAITSVLQHYHHEVPLKILVVCDDIMQADIDLIRSLPTKMNHPQATIDFLGTTCLGKRFKTLSHEWTDGTAPSYGFLALIPSSILPDI